MKLWALHAVRLKSKNCLYLKNRPLALKPKPPAVNSDVGAPLMQDLEVWVAYMHTCIHAFTLTSLLTPCTNTCIHTHIPTAYGRRTEKDSYMHAYMQTKKQTYIHACTIHIHIQIHMHMPYTYTYKHFNTYMQTYMHTYTYTHTHTRTHTHTYKQFNTSIHTYAHIYLPTLSPRVAATGMCCFIIYK